MLPETLTTPLEPIENESPELSFLRIQILAPLGGLRSRSLACHRLYHLVHNHNINNSNINNKLVLSSSGHTYHEVEDPLRPPSPSPHAMTSHGILEQGTNRLRLPARLLSIMGWISRWRRYQVQTHFRAVDVLAALAVSPKVAHETQNYIRKVVNRDVGLGAELAWMDSEASRTLFSVWRPQLDLDELSQTGDDQQLLQKQKDKVNKIILSHLKAKYSDRKNQAQEQAMVDVDEDINMESSVDLYLFDPSGMRLPAAHWTDEDPALERRGQGGLATYIADLAQDSPAAIPALIEGGALNVMGDLIDLHDLFDFPFVDTLASGHYNYAKKPKSKRKKKTLQHFFMCIESARAIANLSAHSPCSDVVTSHLVALGWHIVLAQWAHTIRDYRHRKEGSRSHTKSSSSSMIEYHKIEDRELAKLEAESVRALRNIWPGGRDNQDSHSTLNNQILLLHPKRLVDYENEFDIVFIHGLRGGALYTWRRGHIDTSESYSTQQASEEISRTEEDGGGPTTSSYLSRVWPRTTMASSWRRSAASLDERRSFSEIWPRDWLPEYFPRARILSVRYDSYLTEWWGNTLKLQQQAQEIETSLLQAGVGKRPCIFVTHSYGGLLIKEIVSSCKILQRQTCGIVFYATPHSGSKFASYFGNFRPSQTVVDLIPGGKMLQHVDRKFRSYLNQRGGVPEDPSDGGGRSDDGGGGFSSSPRSRDEPPVEILSFAEGLPTRWVGLSGKAAFRAVMVDEESANPGVGRFIVLKNSDHLNICKPPHPQDKRMTEVVELITRALGKRL